MLPLLLAPGLLLIGTALLVVGADWFLDGAGDLTRALGVSTLVLGVLLAGLEPEEMLTAAIASARGAPTLAVGNVIGTNVTIITAALGLSALIFPVVINRNVQIRTSISTMSLKSSSKQQVTSLTCLTAYPNTNRVHAKVTTRQAKVASDSATAFAKL